MRPSLNAMGIAAAGDPALFEHLMARMGMRVVPRSNDPLNTSVQEEAVAAIASIITESAGGRIRLNRYQRSLKEMAERAGYVVMLEFAPEEFGNNEIGDDPMAADIGGEEEFGAGPEAGGPEGGEFGPEDGGAPSEEEMLSQIPIGAELAREIMAVVKGGGENPDDGLHGEMPVGGPEGEFGGEEGPPPGLGEPEDQPVL